MSKIIFPLRNLKEMSLAYVLDAVATESIFLEVGGKFGTAGTLIKLIIGIKRLTWK